MGAVITRPVTAPTGRLPAVRWRVSWPGRSICPVDLPGGTSGRFSDTGGSLHAENIDKLAEAGITAGCGQGPYCPDRHVTRAQMATFLARALKLVPLPGATPLAADFRLAYSTCDPFTPDANLKRS